MGWVLDCNIQRELAVHNHPFAVSNIFLLQAQRRTEATAMNGNDNQTHESDDEDAGDDDDAEVDDVEEDLVSTQRS